MAGDDSDLTFIRCPGCRSLVPAVATRCRMCGQLLEGKTQNADDQGTQKSRVRQRTMSVNEEERESVKEQIVARKQAPVEEDDDDIPLFPTSGSSSSSGADAYSDETSDDSESLSTSGSSFDLPEAVRAFAQADEQSRGPKQRATVLFDARELDQGDSDDDTDDEEDDSAGDGSSSTAGEEGGKKRRRRRRRKKKPADQVGADTGLNASDSANAQPTNSSDREMSSRGASETSSRGASSGNTVPWRKHAGETESPRSTQANSPSGIGSVTSLSTATNAQRIDEPTAAIRRPPTLESAALRAESERVESSKSSSRSTHESSGAHVNVAGMLCGWLVFTDSNNKSISRELRSGRFFVSREKLRATDIVFEDHSISMPHGMLVASAIDGVHVQDLMSEHGTQIKRAGASSFESVPDSKTTSVGHGDTLRIGNFDVLVCLLPSVPQGK